MKNLEDILDEGVNEIDHELRSPLNSPEEDLVLRTELAVFNRLRRLIREAEEAHQTTTLL